jgi:hypothetical protein
MHYSITFVLEIVCFKGQNRGLQTKYQGLENSCIHTLASSGKNDTMFADHQKINLLVPKPKFVYDIFWKACCHVG